MFNEYPVKHVWQAEIFLQIWQPGTGHSVQMSFIESKNNTIPVILGHWKVFK